MLFKYTKKTSNWHQIRHQILHRAHNACETCGRENYSIHFGSQGGQLMKIVLTVAHLDHDLKNNDPANLRALCQRCHLRHDLALHIANSRASRERKKEAAKEYLERRGENQENNCSIIENEFLQDGFECGCEAEAPPCDSIEEFCLSGIKEE